MRKRKLLTGSLLVLMLLVLILTGCQAGQTSAAEDAEKETPVKIAIIKKGTLNIEHDVIATARANVQVSVVPKIAGELVELQVKKGEDVEKGAVLGKVDSKDLQNAYQTEKTVVDQSNSQLESALISKMQAEDAIKNANLQLQQAELSLKQAGEGQNSGVDNSTISLEQARVNENQAKANYERMSALFSDGVVSKQEYEQAENALAQAELTSQQAELSVENANSNTNIELAEQQVEQAKMAVVNAERQLELAEVNVKQAKTSITQSELRVQQAMDRLEDTNIIAPQSGQVVAVNAEIGELISSAAPFITIVSLDPVKATASISANQLRLFEVGKEIPIEVLALGEEKVATVGYISSVADEAGLYTVEANIANPSKTIKPGMITKFLIEEKVVEKELLVPTEAILEKGGRTYLFVVEDGRVVEKDVDILQAQSELTAVKADIQENTQVVIRGQNTLVDGNKVKIIEEEQ